MKWNPTTKFPIDYLRIGNCNLDVCIAQEKTMSAMEAGFFEDGIAFWDNLYYGGTPPADDVQVKTEL